MNEDYEPQAKFERDTGMLFVNMYEFEEYILESKKEIADYFSFDPVHRVVYGM